jgi:hypothetical protein
MNSGKCQLYDYGHRKNKKEYGTSEPPLMELKGHYMIPTALYSGAKDNLADSVDVHNTQVDLEANGVLVRSWQYANFDHFTFVVGKPENMAIWPRDIIPLMD